MSIPTFTVMAVATDLHRTFLIHATGACLRSRRREACSFFCVAVFGFFIVAQGILFVKRVSANIRKILSPFPCTAIQ
jgi:hypothetical protein